MDPNAQASTSQPAAPAAGPSTSAAPVPHAPMNPVDLYQELYEKLKSNPGQQSVQVIQEMATLLKTGKLRPEQIAQFKSLAEMLVKQHKASDGAAQASQTPQPAPTQPVAPMSHPTTPAPQPMLGDPPASSAGYPISATVSATDPGPVQWQAARSTITGGYAAGRVAGTPAQIRMSGEDSLSLDENRRKRNTPGDQSMRRSIQDLVASVDPNVKIEPEVEDLLLNIADEFIDSVTNFSCRLARHRGGDTLEVKDLQLHLSQNATTTFAFPASLTRRASPFRSPTRQQPLPAGSRRACKAVECRSGRSASRKSKQRRGRTS
ncbi:transcription initiation factor TFIID subunit A-domain-containing protein [Schizophyllum commune]